MKPRVYLAGPMTGIKDSNYPAFHKAAASLRASGYEVENPADNPAPPCETWEGYMRMALRQLVKCDQIALLPGWERSRGATIEARLAADLGMRRIYITQEPPEQKKPCGRFG